MATILANRVAPGLLDRYLGRTGYDAQQTDEPLEPARTTNLWEPVPGDHGAHGAFDARAHQRSWAAWISRHRRWVVWAGLAPTAATGGALVRRRRR